METFVVAAVQAAYVLMDRGRRSTGSPS